MAIAKASAELQSIERSLAGTRSLLPSHSGGHGHSFSALHDATLRSSHFQGDGADVDVTTSPDGRQVRVAVTQRQEGGGLTMDSAELGRELGVAVGPRSSSMSVLRALQMLQDKIKRIERSKSEVQRQLEELQADFDRYRAAHGAEIAEIDRARELERAEFHSTIARLEARLAAQTATGTEAAQQAAQLSSDKSVSAPRNLSPLARHSTPPQCAGAAT